MSRGVTYLLLLVFIDLCLFSILFNHFCLLSFLLSSMSSFTIPLPPCLLSIFSFLHVSLHYSYSINLPLPPCLLFTIHGARRVILGK